MSFINFDQQTITVDCFNSSNPCQDIPCRMFAKERKGAPDFCTKNLVPLSIPLSTKLGGSVEVGQRFIYVIHMSYMFIPESCTLVK